MALTLEQRTNEYSKSHAPQVYVVSSDLINEPKFTYNFIIQISRYTGGSPEIYNFEVPPSPNGKGVMDFSRITRDLVKPDIERFTGNPMFEFPNFGEKLSLNKEAFIQCRVLIIESYYDSQGQNIKGIPSDTVYFVFPGYGRPEEGYNHQQDHGFMTDGIASKFMHYWPQKLQEIDISFAGEANSGGNRKLRIPISSLDHFCLSWFDCGLGVSPPGSPIGWFRVTMFMKDGGQESTTWLNSGANGGTNGQSLESQVLYFMCGAKDLADNNYFSPSFRPEPDSNWSHYVVYAASFEGVVQSHHYEFYREEGRCGLDYYQLQFSNRFGGWNFQSLHLVNKRKVRIKSNKYRKAIQRWKADDSFGFEKHSRGVGHYGKTGTTRIQLNTNWLQDHEVDALEDYLLSTEIYIYKNGSTTPIPVLSIERVWEEKRRQVDQLFRYTFNVELSQKINEW